MLSLTPLTGLCAARPLHSVLLPLQCVCSDAPWSVACCSPQRLADTRERLVSWLPPTVRQKLISELCNGTSPASQRPRPEDPSSRPSSGAQSQVSTGKRSTATPDEAVKKSEVEVTAGIEGNVEATAGLTLLSVLLYPALEADTEASVTCEREAVQSLEHQLELVCALLLPYGLFSLPLGAPAGSSLYACVQAQAVLESSQQWRQYFLLFFLDQLHCERVRLAAMKGSATRPKLAHVHLPLPSRDGGSLAGTRTACPAPKRSSKKSTPQPAEGKTSFLHKLDPFQRTYPLHSFAHSISQAVEHILESVKTASLRRGGDLRLGAATSTQHGVLQRLINEQRKQAASTVRTAYRQGRPSVKGTPGRCSLKQRRRFSRESSSDSVSFSSSEQASASSSSSSTLSASTGKRRVAGIQCTRDAKNLLDCRSEDAWTADGDIPLAVLASSLASHAR
jgi:hypothetical protein